MTPLKRICLLLLHVLDSMATTYDVSSIVLGQTIRVNYPPKGNPIACAVSLAIDEINADATLLPNTQLFARTLSTNCSAMPTMQTMLDQLAPYWDGYTAGVDGPVIGIVGTYCSSAALAASSISSWGWVPMIAYGATSPALSDKYKYPWFLRYVPTNADAGSVMVAMAKQFGWSTITTLHQEDDVWAKDVMAAVINTITDQADMSIGWSAITYGDSPLQASLASLKKTGLRVLVTLVMDETARDDLAQTMMDLGMVQGFALITPGSGQGFADRGLDTDGLPLLGILSSGVYSKPSVALTAYKDKVAANCPNGGVTVYNGRTFQDDYVPYGPIAYDAVYGYARALDTVLNANGGAQSCSLEPGGKDFQLQLRQALYSDTFSGPSGVVAVTQCAGADWAAPGMVSSTSECGSTGAAGDRTGVDQEILNYQRTAGVNKWERVALVNTDTATLTLVADTQFYFLGNTPIVPADSVPFPTCEPGYFKDELKECQRCDIGKYTNEQDLAMCITCPMGKYNHNVNSSTCADCPDHALCFDGTQISADDGYWADLDHPTGEFFKCFPPASKCLSGLNASLCETGYEGVMCGVCSYDYSLTAGECTKCPEGGGISPLGWVVVALGLLIVVVVVVGLTPNPLVDQERELRELFDIMDLNDGVCDDLIEKRDFRWAVEQITATGTLKLAHQNLLDSIDKTNVNDISFGLFCELITEGTLDTYAPNTGNQAHVASLGSAIQTQQLNADLNPDADLMDDQLDDMDVGEIGDEALAAVDDLAGAAEDMANAASAIGGPFKIIVAQFQVFSAITVAMPIDWPDAITSLSMSFSFVRVDFVTIFGIGCMTEVNPVMFAVFGLTAILVVLAMVATLLFFVFSQTLKDSKDFFYKWESAVVFLAYPEVAMVSLSTFNCIDIYGTWYKSSDLSKTCYDSEWTLDAAISMFGIIFYVVGSPLRTVLILLRNKHKLYTDQNILARYGVLYKRYEPEYYYWELTENLRKLLLTSAIIFIYAGTARQLAFALLISFLFLAVHFKFQPYDDDGDDNLQTLSLVSACLTMLYGCVVVAGEDSPVFMVLVLVSVMSTVFYFIVVFVQGPLPLLVDAAKVGTIAIAGFVSKQSTSRELIGALKAVPYDKLGSAETPNPSMTGVIQATADFNPLHKGQSESELKTSPIAVGAIEIALPPIDASEENEEDGEAQNVADAGRLHLMREAFERYDLDGSNSINSREEMEQLTINVVFKLDLSIKKAEVEELIDMVPDIVEKPMSFEEFVQWFERGVAKNPDTVTRS